MSANAPRRELTRHELALRGLVAVVAAALALGLLYLRGSGTFGGPEHVAAQLTDAGGSLSNGADVKIRGVIVGKVSGIERGPSGGVRVGLAIPGSELDMIPAEVVARVLPATVFGTSYVDLTVPGATSGRSLQAGAVIPADSRQGTLELQQALDDIDELVKAVGPAQLASAIGSAAQALKGRGAELGETIDAANAYLAKLGPRLGAVRSDLSALADNAELLDQVAPDLLQATSDALTTMHTIVDQAPTLATIITGGTALTERADAFLGRHAADLIRFVDNSARLLDVVYANRYAGITGALVTNKLLEEKLSSIMHHGFLDASTTFLADVPPYYTSADCPRFGAAHGDNCGGLARAGVTGLATGGGR